MASLFQQYEKDFRKALEVLFETKGDSYSYHGKGPCLFLWTGCSDKNGTKYGSYKHVYLEELKTRVYDVYWADYMVAIHYLDYVYVSRSK